jgi:hypothetical protein
LPKWLLSCLLHDVIAALTVAYDLLVGGLLVPVIGAMLWRRATTTAALASIALGGSLVIVLLGVYGMGLRSADLCWAGRQLVRVRGAKPGCARAAHRMNCRCQVVCYRMTA